MAGTLDHFNQVSEYLTDLVEEFEAEDEDAELADAASRVIDTARALIMAMEAENEALHASLAHVAQVEAADGAAWPIDAIFRGFLAEVESGEVPFVDWLGSPMRVQPFAKGEHVDVARARPVFNHRASKGWAGHVYLHFCSPLSRVLVSLDGRDFIGMIGITRTLDALEILNQASAATVCVPARIVGSAAGISIEHVD